MTVQIDWADSTADADEGVCWLTLTNPEKPGGDHLGSFAGYADNSVVPDDSGVWWTWANPSEPLENVTFSPSLIHHVGDKQMFHIFIRGGEIEHCGDCECGCRE